MIVEQDAFVLFLLFLQDPHLLFEVVDRLPEPLIKAVRQAGQHRKPQMSSHSRQRLPGCGLAGKRFRSTMTQLQVMEIGM